jgi:hypothetical protein
MRKDLKPHDALEETSSRVEKERAGRRRKSRM